MSDQNIRTVKFIGDQRGFGEDLYRCIETGKVYVRQECDDTHVRWLTSVKWQDGYEADCHLKSGLILNIVDKTGTILFQECVSQVDGYCYTVAKKEAPFSWEAINTIAAAIAKRYALKSRDEWYSWLGQAAKDTNYAGYLDTWLYCEVKYMPSKKIDNAKYLGIPVTVEAEAAEHKICGKTWTSYEIVSADHSTCLAICGYQFQKKEK